VPEDAPADAQAPHSDEGGGDGGAEGAPTGERGVVVAVEAVVAVGAAEEEEEGDALDAALLGGGEAEAGELGGGLEGEVVHVVVEHVGLAVDDAVAAKEGEVGRYDWVEL